MTDTSNALEPVLSFLRQHRPFRFMLPVHQEYLAMYLEQVFYAESDDILTSQDGIVDSFYIIKQGCVSGEPDQNITNNTDRMKKLLGPGDCFPISALQLNRAVYCPHQAIKSTICYKLKQFHFEYLLQQSDIFRDFFAQKNLKSHTESS